MLLAKLYELYDREFLVLKIICGTHEEVHAAMVRWNDQSHLHSSKIISNVTLAKDVK